MLKIGDKLFIVYQPNGFGADAPVFAISEIKEITNTEIYLYPIIGVINSIYLGDHRVNDFIYFDESDSWYSHVIITVDEQKAINRYQELLKEYEKG